MSNGVIPWKRYALLVDIIEKVAKDHLCQGRTALQKFIYLLQELYQVDCGYDFRFYTYGPFSSEILCDLDTLESCKGIHAEYVGGYGGYDFTPNSMSERFKSKEPAFLQDNQDKIDRMLQDFGNNLAKDLELYATIVWVDRSLKVKGKDWSEGTIASLVHDLKPKFDRSAIDSKVDWLKNRGHIRADA